MLTNVPLTWTILIAMWMHWGNVECILECNISRAATLDVVTVNKMTMKKCTNSDGHFISVTPKGTYMRPPFQQALC